LVEQSSDLANF